MTVLEPRCPCCPIPENVPCPANDNQPATRRIFIASDWELRRISHFQRLAIAIANLGMSRREILDWVADVIYGNINRGGALLNPDGTPFPVPYVDDVFRDPDGRWLSDFIAFADRTPGQRPQKRVVPRLRLLDLALRIAFPCIGRHLGR